MWPNTDNNFCRLTLSSGKKGTIICFIKRAETMSVKSYCGYREHEHGSDELLANFTNLFFDIPTYRCTMLELGGEAEKRRSYNVTLSQVMFWNIFKG